MIGIAREDEQIAAIADAVLNDGHPACWNLAVPPGFGDWSIAKKLAECMRRHRRAPVVALVTADNLPGPQGYIEFLHAEWSKGCKLPDLVPGQGEMAALESLLHALPAMPPVVQIVNRFHAAIVKLGDWVLGQLRDAEQDHRLLTVTLTPCTLRELKERWREEGHVLTVSNYGDTHMMEYVQVMPLEAALVACETEGVPAGIAKYIYQVTGGYPEPFTNCIRNWKAMNRPQLLPDVRQSFLISSSNLLDRFIKHLDRNEGSLFREYVIDLYQKYDPEIALEHLSMHEWKDILLDGDSLRSEAVGRAAIAMSIDEAVHQNTLEASRHAMFERAQRQYKRKQYSEVLTLLEKGRVVQTRKEIEFLKVHARLMNALYRGDRSADDPDWKGLIAAAKQANEVLEQFRRDLPDIDANQMASRYVELREIANDVIRAISASKNEDDRLIDVLVGLLGDAAGKNETAALLLIIKRESGDAICGDASACQAVLSLPEQLFRVWAWWNMKLNYYSAPKDSDEAWKEAESQWLRLEKGKRSLQRTNPGDQFGSFSAFAYFALAKHEATMCGNEAPESGFDNLQKALSFYEQMRNAQSHSVVTRTSSKRKQYFELIDRWLDATVATCPTPIHRDALLAKVLPLPLVQDIGTVEWL